MEIEYKKLPKGAVENLKTIAEISLYAEDIMYEITFVDYNNGLIKFKSLTNEFTINIYATTLTLSVEFNNNTIYKKGLNAEQIKKVIADPKKVWESS